ncbi:MAG TPA: nitrilase-related carbon-nitrogen hydrolase [Catalimonadaceae bacterium]|nr:nitrilase-related carbon-nitrogen hydrolase [Catalimonadaceae bacterium]
MKKEELSISLVQANVAFDSVEGNLSHLEELLERDSSESDIYLLPELFNTGYRNAFHMKAEKMGLYTTRWMKQMAARKKGAICGSVAIDENGQVFNRMLFVEPSGTIQYYDKVNVFAFSGEDKMFSAGQKDAIFEYLGWRIKAIICFDLRFPESVRNKAPYFDLIVCSAHWPSPRIQAWDTLIPARAIENQSYFAATNRYGAEGEAMYPGHSVVIDFKGTPMIPALKEECIVTCKLKSSELDQFRASFPFLKPAL